MRSLVAAGLCALAVLAGGPVPRRRLARAVRVPAPATRTGLGSGDPALRARAPAGSGRATGYRALPWPVVLDLVAAVLTAGAAVPAALRSVAACLDEVGDPSGPLLREAARALETGSRERHRGTAGWPSPLAELLATLDLSAGTGLAPVSLVRADAAAMRRRRRADQAVAAQRLGVLLVLPTGLCLLPAFVFLTVAPLVLDLLS